MPTQVSPYKFIICLLLVCSFMGLVIISSLVDSSDELVGPGMKYALWDNCTFYYSWSNAA